MFQILGGIISLFLGYYYETEGEALFATIGLFFSIAMICSGIDTIICHIRRKK